MVVAEEIGFDNIKKSSIVNNKGVRYSDFKASLKPDYLKVWVDIAAGYLFLILVLAAVGYLQSHYPSFFYLTIPVGALLLGYIIAYINLFIHEASHYNIAPDRNLNDKLANIFIGLMVGMDIKFYRIIHFDHHRFLGTAKDTENTYFNPLNWRFLFESLTGLRVIKVMTGRENKVKENDKIDKVVIAKNKKMFYSGALLNLAIVLAFVFTGYWQVAVTWLIGMGVMFPFFASLRQLLEHRREDAHASVDYSKEDQGEITRMFGTGLISSTMGGAGFNRHLLHHWDPQVSYTRLKDIERFLKDTPLYADMQKNSSTYSTAFYKLFNH